MKKRLSKFIAFLIVFAMLLPVSASVTETVQAKAAAVSLNATSKTLQEGQTYQLKVNNLLDSQKVTWKSNRTSVVKVSTKGRVTAVAAGTTTVIATVTDSTGKTVSTLKCSVTVKTPEGGIALSAVSRTIGIGEKFQLSVENLDMEEVDTITWTANNTKVAKVDAKSGLVTGVKAGSTEIRLKIVYLDETIKIYPCYVTVKKISAATDFKLSNLSYDDVLNVTLGKTATVKATKVPSNGSGTIEWKSKNENVATVSSSGTVTGKKVGITVITATMGSVQKEFYVNVTKAVEPTKAPSATPTPVAAKQAKVTSVTMTGSSEIKVTFDTAISKNTLITSDNKLVSGTVVIGKENGNTDLGQIKPALSNDGKTLTLTTEGRLNGTYSIVLSSKIKSTTGLSLAQYSQIADWKDTVGPKYLYTDTDHTGFVSQIHFDEALDITNLSVDVSSTIANATIQYHVKNVSNYKLSEDRKTILIDLSSVAFGKAIEMTVKLRGIRDIAGNSTANLQETVTLMTDTTPLPPVELLNVERVSKTKLKVTYSGPITDGGTMVLSATYVISADRIESGANTCEAFYTIPDKYQNLKDSMRVTFRDWRSSRCNTLSSKEVIVSFALDTTPPTLTKYSLETSTNNGVPIGRLILTYNKEVNYVTQVLNFNMTAYDNYGNVSSAVITSVSAMVSGNTITYVFNDTKLLADATFAITIPVGAVKDAMDNPNTAETIQIKRSSATTTELPGPISVTQDTTSPNVVVLQFQNKVDPTTAQSIANYYIVEGSNKYYPLKAEVYSQNDSGAIVKLTFNASVFSGATTSYELAITGVKGYNDSYSAITNFRKLFSAVDASVPHVVSATYYTGGTTLVVSLSKAVTGIMSVKLIDEYEREIEGFTASKVTNQDNVIIVLDSVVPSNVSSLKMKVYSSNMVDAQGNKLSPSNTMYTVEKR